jgi:hypothetical protein
MYVCVIMKQYLILFIYEIIIHTEIFISTANFVGQDLVQACQSIYTVKKKFLPLILFVTIKMKKF